MEKETGWIKLHRSLLNWEWYNNKNTKELFIHLLLKVNYENKKWQGVDIPRGSYITSINHLAQELNLTPRKIRTALDNLKTTKEVSIKTTKKYTRVSIENWGKYQGNDFENDKVNVKEKDIEMTTTKEIKNININLIINKYMKNQPKTLREKMQLIRTIKQNENLNPAEETELENYILM